MNARHPIVLYVITKACTGLGLVAIGFVLSACGPRETEFERMESGRVPAAEMYRYAERLRTQEADIPSRAERGGVRLNNRFDWAGHFHDQIERFFPDSPYAALGQLRQGEAYYDEGDYDRAVPELEEFILAHPGHPQLDHAYYLAAMSAFSQISTDGLDPGDTKDSITRFSKLLRVRPDTQYREEAERRILAAQTQLAATEIRLGLTLQRSKNFQGAIARYLQVVNNYENTPYIEEALYRLVESYLSLGLRGEAENYGKLLGVNYPKSQWYAQAYGLLTGQPVPAANSSNFIDRLFGR